MSHRQKELTLMHCVAAYPTANTNLQLNQIDMLKVRYPHVDIGYSTHENPSNFAAVQVAIAKGARVFEKHVGLKNEKYAVNDYSATPNQVREWLKAASEAFDMCGIEGHRYSCSTQEQNDLKSLRRSVYLKSSVVPGDNIDSSMITLAIPYEPGQIQANDLSKYVQLKAKKKLAASEPLFFEDVEVLDKHSKVGEIVQKVRSLLKESGVVVGNRLDFEISHHYGLEKFYLQGCTIINYINREYCKKIIVVLPGQQHPEQYHKLKEETFHLLFGDLQIVLDGVKTDLSIGDIATVERGMKHSFSSTNGAVLEEISSTHYANDSFYIDAAINANKDRKTIITNWMG
jgi:quercetin dioxygenase-like cupin family protein